MEQSNSHSSLRRLRQKYAVVLLLTLGVAAFAVYAGAIPVAVGLLGANVLIALISEAVIAWRPRGERFTAGHLQRGFRNDGAPVL